MLVVMTWWKEYWPTTLGRTLHHRAATSCADLDDFVNSFHVSSCACLRGCKDEFHWRMAWLHDRC